jgi:outer membrane protein assembly factor BamB
LISAAAGDLRSYDPSTGALLWSLPWDFSAVSEAIAADERRIYVAARQPRPTVIAIGCGDAKSAPRVEWRTEIGGDSPVALQRVDDAVLLLAGDGNLISFHAETGKLDWRRRLPGGYLAPPIATGTQLLCVNTDGLLVTVDFRQRGKIISELPLCDGAIGPTAITRRQILVRTDAGLASFSWTRTAPPVVHAPKKPQQRL